MFAYRINKCRRIRHEMIGEIEHISEYNANDEDILYLCSYTQVRRHVQLSCDYNPTALSRCYILTLSDKIKIFALETSECPDDAVIEGLICNSHITDEDAGIILELCARNSDNNIAFKVEQITNIDPGAYNALVEAGFYMNCYARSRAGATKILSYTFGAPFEYKISTNCQRWPLLPCLDERAFDHAEDIDKLFVIEYALYSTTPWSVLLRMSEMTGMKLGRLIECQMENRCNEICDNIFAIERLYPNKSFMQLDGYDEGIFEIRRHDQAAKPKPRKYYVDEFGHRVVAYNRPLYRRHHAFRGYYRKHLTKLVIAIADHWRVLVGVPGGADYHTFAP